MKTLAQRGVKGIGKEQRRVMGLLTNWFEPLAPIGLLSRADLPQAKPAAWAAQGWVRISKAWRILDGLKARGLVQVMTPADCGWPGDWPTWTDIVLARLTEKGRLALA